MATNAVKHRAVVTLPTDTQIRIEREFDAPRDLVFRAFTEPELVKRWWSAKRGTVTTADSDLRVGGRWRRVLSTDRGFDVAFHGENLEIVPNERLVHTEVFEGMPDAQAVVTTTFVEHDGRTLVTILVEHATKANRDAHVGSGMEAGMQDAFELLDDVVRALA